MKPTGRGFGHRRRGSKARSNASGNCGRGYRTDFENGGNIFLREHPFTANFPPRKTARAQPVSEPALGAGNGRGRLRDVLKDRHSKIVKSDHKRPGQSHFDPRHWNCI